MDKLIDVFNQILYQKMLSNLVNKIRDDLISESKANYIFMCGGTARDLIYDKSTGYDWKQNRGL
ncbi:MAG TPA: hypothetical protein ENH82_14025 [bacterium]|nr:hypothetical protein [bacterium]